MQSPPAVVLHRTVSFDGQELMKYHDPDFEATTDSVGRLSEGPGVVEGPGYEVDWKHATTIFGEQLQLFNGNADPNDVRQGSLGNCYFLCALASIAKIPHRINNLFVEAIPGEYHGGSAELEPHGLYGVKFCVNGGRREVILDDQFPCFRGTNEPCFAKCFSRSDLWALLLEKAYAKCYGSYEAISEGYAGL